MIFEDATLLQILGYILPIVLVSLGLGMVLGRNLAQSLEDRRLRVERERTLKALQAMLTSTDTLTQQVDVRNSELRTVEQSVGHMQSAHDLEQIQSALLQQISYVIESNRKLEEDLNSTRYELQQQAVQLDQTKREARTDPLSGVANRKGFDEHLEYLLGKYRGKQTGFGLILADVDHFKWINDTHGHAAGDRVVTGIGELLRVTVRPSDFVARIGGDEFAILLAGVDLETAVPVAERIRQAVERSNFASGEQNACLSVTFSMGLALPLTTDETAPSLLERADRALYVSKAQGRNQLNVCTSDAIVSATC